MTSDDVVIDVRDVGVTYRLPRERVRTFKQFALDWVRRRIVYNDLEALGDVSFQIRRGESVAIIGRNGAGKSTLLKVIARVLRPGKGSIRVVGNVTPLLELGAGFDSELSGRENIFLNGAIFGRSRKEMTGRFDAIVAFAELAEFVDAPLRTYSTGMVARLGFAIATDIEPDVMLVDEILSVGDIGFQQKCSQRIQEFLTRRATLILVSHSTETVRTLCQRAIWLDHGRVIADGPAHEVAEAFEAETTGRQPTLGTGTHSWRVGARR